jgi:hypothetical protein
MYRQIMLISFFMFYDLFFFLFGWLNKKKEAFNLNLKFLIKKKVEKTE